MTAVVKFVSVDQADIGFPSPDVLSFALNAGMDLISIYRSGNLDLFNIAFRKGEGMKDLKGLEGKTVLLGSAALQSIADPVLAAVGVDLTKVTHVEAGWPIWTTALQGGQGDACLAWEGLRADLGAKGPVFDHWFGMRGSPLPTNLLVVGRADLEDPERLVFLQKDLRGWAMGSDFADRNPRAAATIVFKALQTIKANYGPRAGTERLMQVYRPFKGDMAARAGWDEHNIPPSDNFFKILKTIGQLAKRVVARFASVLLSGIFPRPRTVRIVHVMDSNEDIAQQALAGQRRKVPLVGRPPAINL